MSELVFTVSAQAHYDAAHFLNDYQGKCARLHGHRYVVEAAIQVPEVGPSGIAFDFVDFKKLLRDLADELDHENLNELPPFQGIETTAENQAKHFYDQLAANLPEALRGGLLYARVWESPTQWAQYGRAGASPPAPTRPGA